MAGQTSVWICCFVVTKDEPSLLWESLCAFSGLSPGQGRSTGPGLGAAVGRVPAAGPALSLRGLLGPRVCPHWLIRERPKVTLAPSVPRYWALFEERMGRFHASWGPGTVLALRVTPLPKRWSLPRSCLPVGRQAVRAPVS